MQPMVSFPCFLPVQMIILILLYLSVSAPAARARHPRCHRGPNKWYLSQFRSVNIIHFSFQKSWLVKSPSSSLFPFHLRREKEYSLYNNVFKPQPLPAAEDEIEMCLVQFRDRSGVRSLLSSLALSLQSRAGGWVWLKCSCPLHLLTTSPPLLLTMQGWVLSSFLCPHKIRHYGRKCQKKK